MNRPLIFLTTAALSLGLLVSPALTQTVTNKATPHILSIPSHDNPLHVAIAIPQNVETTKGQAWQLVEVDHPQTTIPVQFVAMSAGDSPDKPNGKQLLAIIPPQKGTTNQRRFRLEPFVPKKPAVVEFDFRQISKASLGLWERDRPVLVYNHGQIINQDVPEEDHRRERACYIHPLWGLNNEILTDDFPTDHYHHHGIFWAWPHVGIGGQEYDLWTHRGIKQKFIRSVHREAGPIASVLAVKNGWYVGDKQVMTEQVWMRIYKADSNSRVIEISLLFSPTDQPVTLQGAQGKSYGGLTMRFAPPSRKETIITVPNGQTKDDLPDTPLAWADFTTQFGSAQKRSGAAIFVHPDHPNFPPTWLTRYYGPLCIGWPGVNAKTFQPGESFRLNYRFWIHKNPADLSQLKQEHQSYLSSTKAIWE